MATHSDPPEGAAYMHWEAPYADAEDPGATPPPFQSPPLRGPNLDFQPLFMLLEALRRLSKDEFKQTMLKGRPEKGMPNFDGSKMVTENLDGLYAYLKGRADGAIKPGRLEELR